MSQRPTGRPLLIYDGDCGFCRLWIDYWRKLTRDRVAYAPFQEVAARFPEIPLEEFARSVQFITADGKVLSGAHAVFQALAYAPSKAWMLWVYTNVPGAAFLAEWAYRLVAGHRPFFQRLVRLLGGKRSL